MTAACSMAKVVICAWMVENMMVVAQIGNMHTTCLSSSMSVRVHRIHLLASVGDSPAARSTMAAWSRNLHKKNLLYYFH
jgi:hypothetical protein